MKQEKTKSGLIRNSISNELFAALVKPRSYLNLVAVLLFSVLLFVLGMGVFFTVVVGFAFISSPVFAVVLYPFVDLDIGSLKIDVLGEAIVVTIIGLLILSLLLYLINKLIWIFKENVSIRVGRFYFGNKNRLQSK